VWVDVRQQALAQHLQLGLAMRISKTIPPVLALAGMLAFTAATYIWGWQEHTRWLTFASILVVIAGIVTFRWVRQRVIAAKKLATTVQQMATGDTGVPADESLPGSFGTIAIALNQFLRVIRASEARSLLVRQQAARLDKFYEARSALNQEMIRLREPDTLFDRFCHICVETGHASLVWVSLVRDAKLQAVAWSSSTARECTQGLYDDFDISTIGEYGLVGPAISQGVAGVCNDYLNDKRTARWRDLSLKYTINSACVVPIQRDGHVLGTVNLYSSELNFFDDSLVALLTEMAQDLSFGLDNFERQRGRETAEKQAAASFRQLRSIFDMLPAMATIQDLRDLRILDINGFGCQLIGRSRETVIGKTTAELNIGMEPADRVRLLETLRETGVVSDFECPIRVSPKRQVQMLLNARRVWFQGTPAFLAICVDISERKEAVQALQSRERELANLVETAMDAIITIDSDQKIVLFNDAAADMFGIPAQKAVGMPISALLPEHIRSKHDSHVTDALQTGDVFRRSMGRPMAIYGQRANGEEFPADITLSRTYEAEGSRITAIVRDMTKFLAAEVAARQVAAAQAASQAKTEFLSRVSHELRTPLNAVLGFSRLLQQTAKPRLTGTEVEQLDYIFLGAAQLRALIDDVLDVSRIEAGGVTIDLRDIELKGLMESAVRMVESQAASQSIQVIKAYASMAAMSLRVDPLRLRQVLLNLISNAIKYNRPGGWVKVAVELTQDFVHVLVQDNGMGMSQEQLAALFQPFNRLGRERGSIEGTGLGMALVRQLVELMGGMVSVESEVDKGTLVRVSLPYIAAVAPTEVTEEEVPPPTMPALLSDQESPSGVVLYIEDNPVNSILAMQLLSRWPGVQLVVAEDGSSGLQRAQELQPDLVLLDMQLPDMTGMDVLRDLRQDSRTSNLCIVVLSASAMAEEVEAARQAGANDYWTKPIDFNQFHVGVLAALQHAQT
jgi:PAS domain S-box-containing protein